MSRHFQFHENIFDKRNQVLCRSQKLRRLTRALAPSVLRFGGTEANCATFVTSDSHVTSAADEDDVEDSHLIDLSGETSAHELLYDQAHFCTVLQMVG